MAENVCEIRTTGGVYREWLSVSVGQSYDAYSMRVIQLRAAEPSRKTFLLKPGDRIDVALAGTLVIKEGYIRTRSVQYAANQHVVALAGMSKASQLAKVSIDTRETGSQFRGYKVEALANAVLKPHGIKFRIDGGPSGHDLPFPNVAVHHGESPWSFLRRLCRQRGLWLRDDPDGTIVAGSKEKAGGNAIVFEEGRNILAATCSLEMKSVDQMVTDSQQPGSDSLFGKKASEVSAKGQVSGGAKGTRIIAAEMAASAKEATLRTNMAVAELEANAVRVAITYQGWERPGLGGLWDMSEVVKVKSPMLLPTDDGAAEMKLWAYNYLQDAEAGTTTTVELVNPKAFQNSNPDANAGSDFYKPNTPANPQEPA